MSNRFKETAAEIKSAQERDTIKTKIAALKGLADGSVVPVPLELIDRSQNIRQGPVDLNSDEFKQFVESIKEVGLLQHPVITIHNDQIICVAGHRRLAALEVLGQRKPPCILRHFEKLEMKDAARLLENTARKALYPLELADELMRLQSLGYNQVRLQELLGKDRKTIGRFQKMSAWPETAKDLIRAHPEQLKSGLLLQLASKTISETDLLAALQKALGQAPAKPKASGEAKAKGVGIRIAKYFTEKKLSSRDQELIMGALTDLGFLRGGILDPTPTGRVQGGQIAESVKAPSRLPRKAAKESTM